MEALLPNGVSLSVAALLVVTSFFTSAITAALAMGGGLTLLAVMGMFLPVSVLVPVHGLVQLGSNTGRAVALKNDIEWGTLGLFFVFGLLGAVLAAYIVIELPDAWLRVTLGLFVVLIVWVKLPAIAAKSRWLVAFGGFVTSALTMFLGATGPLVVALFSKHFDRKEALIATSAAAMVFQHGVKVFAFGVLGFAFLQWLPLVGAMIVSGFLGTLTGIKLLRRLPEARFRLLLKIMITLLGADMIRRGWLAL
ncbi:MAG: sulfite exporter TauE/SafE family protein [Pseudomonadota bacterium]